VVTSHVPIALPDHARLDMADFQIAPEEAYA